MQILINTDRNISSDARLEEFARGAAHAALDRFSDRLTRVEFHLSDENGTKEGGKPSLEKRCVIEARPAGRQPVGVTHHAPSVKEALTGALVKLANMLEGIVGKELERR